MRNILFLLLFLFGIHTINAQEPDEDSLRTIVSQHKGDRTEVDALSLLGALQQQLDSATLYAQKGLSLAKNINYKKGIADCYLVLQEIYNKQRNFSQAIQYTLDGLAVKVGSESVATNACGNSLSFFSSFSIVKLVQVSRAAYATYKKFVYLGIEPISVI